MYKHYSFTLPTTTYKLLYIVFHSNANGSKAKIHFIMIYSLKLLIKQLVC